MNTPFQTPVSRTCILTLSDGSKARVTARIYLKPRYSQRDYEKEFVDFFNRQQPHMVNKVVDCHLLRN